MDQRARRIVIAIAVIFVIVLSSVAMYFATRPQPQTALQDTPAWGLTVATDDQVNNLGYLLKREGIPYVVVDARTLGVRPDDLDKAKSAITEANKVDGYQIDYVVASTKIEQPDKPTSTSTGSQPPSASPSESAPTASPAPTGDPSNSPSSAASEEPSDGPSPAETTAANVEDDNEPTFDLKPIPTPETLNGDAAAIVGYDFTSPASAWDSKSSMIGSVQYGQIVTFTNPAAVSKFLEWQDVTQKAGREGDMSIFNYTNDPLVYTSFVEIPQKIKNELINYVGASNVTFSGAEPTISFLVTVPMPISKANGLLPTLPLAMTAAEVPGGKVMFMYTGPMPSVTQFDALGKAFEKASGAKVAAITIG